MKVLIAGISSVTGRLVCSELLKRDHKVCGIDVRPSSDISEEVEIHTVDIRKRAAEQVFRIFKPDAVVHMATVTHLERSTEDRYRINLGGTKRVFEYCTTYNVKQLIFVGRHTVYGAVADAPLYHKEDSPPMAGTVFPELADLVAADLYAGQALWRYPDLNTVVLRVVYELGPSRHATLASFLKGPRVPMVFGFDPLFQIIHEFDIARAVVASLEGNIRGVYNVVGPDPVPLSVLIEQTGRSRVALPELLYKRVIGRFGLPTLSVGAIEHIKYPVVVDGQAFRQATGFRHRYSEHEAMAGFRLGVV